MREINIMKLHSQLLGKGQPFIILHGFLGMGDNWKTLGNRFAEAGFEMHLVDQRNHGRSFHDDVFDYDVMAEDLRHYCIAHKLKEVILLGHSMGGKTAMLFAARYPEFVSRLIVADISPRYYPIHHDIILNGLSELDFNEIKSRGAAEKALAKHVSDRGTRMFLLKNLYWVEKGQLALRINLDVLKANVSEVGEALPIHVRFEKPTLFLKGDKSEYIMPDDDTIIKQHFPKAKVITVSNSGHWLHAENPDEFYENVLNFIAD